MERKKYLEMCRECATFREGTGGIRKDIPEALKVVFCGIEYYPAAYELSFDRLGDTVHTAVLHEIAANAVVYAPLGKVEEK